MATNDDETSKKTLLAQFYHACESGDLKKVRELLPHFQTKRVALIEFEFKSALDAAVANGHGDVAQYLLDYDYFRRPLINTADERSEWVQNFLVKRLFDFDGRFYEQDLNDCMNFQPSFENVRQYTSASQAQAAQFLMQVAHAPRLLRPLIRRAVTKRCIDNLSQIIDATLRQHSDQSSQNMIDLFRAFRDGKDINSLVKLYTLPKPHMSTILRGNSGSYLALIYLNLVKLRDRAYIGLSYRGLKESPGNLDHYRSAMKHNHIIECSNLISTSKLNSVAEMYSYGATPNAHAMIIKFDFKDEACPTALDLAQEPCISQIPDEEEVLVLAHTLFRVTDIEQTGPTTSNPYERLTITFKYVPVTAERSISSFIWERSRLE